MWTTTTEEQKNVHFNSKNMILLNNNVTIIENPKYILCIITILQYVPYETYRQRIDKLSNGQPKLKLCYPTKL